MDLRGLAPMLAALRDRAAGATAATGAAGGAVAGAGIAQEVGASSTRVKWQPHAGKGIRGYHVYRYDGRWAKDSITRVTTEPITATEFLDEQAGKESRRYEVVAVDALGQEGEPSTPVWSRTSTTRRSWPRCTNDPSPTTESFPCSRVQNLAPSTTSSCGPVRYPSIGDA